MNRLQRIGHNESNSRDRNEVTSGDAGEGRGNVEFICECGDLDCTALLTMTRAEYEEVRSVGTRFAVAGLDHVFAEAESVNEKVLANFGRFVVVEKHSDAQTVADLRDPRPHAKSRRVLVADHSYETRALLKMLLSVDPDCTVVAEASDGVEAIEAAENTHPDVIVMDLEMPRMDGWEALPKLVEAVPTANIVVFSAGADVDERKLAALGAFDFVAKGSDPLVIAGAVKEAARSGAIDARTLSAKEGRVGN